MGGTCKCLEDSFVKLKGRGKLRGQVLAEIHGGAKNLWLWTITEGPQKGNSSLGRCPKSNESISWSVLCRAEAAAEASREAVGGRQAFATHEIACRVLELLPTPYDLTSASILPAINTSQADPFLALPIHTRDPISLICLGIPIFDHSA